MAGTAYKSQPRLQGRFVKAPEIDATQIREALADMKSVKIPVKDESLPILRLAWFWGLCLLSGLLTGILTVRLYHLT